MNRVIIMRWEISKNRECKMNEEMIEFYLNYAINDEN